MINNAQARQREAGTDDTAQASRVNALSLTLSLNLVKTHMALGEAAQARKLAAHVAARHPTCAEAHYLAARAIYMAADDVNFDKSAAEAEAGITRARQLITTSGGGGGLSDKLAALERAIARRRRQHTVQREAALRQFAQRAFSRPLAEYPPLPSGQDDAGDVRGDGHDDDEDNEDEQLRRAMELDALDRLLGRVPVLFKSNGGEPIFGDE